MKKKIFAFLFIFSLFSFSLRADEGNAIIVCDNSLEMLGWDLEFIRHAKHTVEIGACFAGGNVIRELLLTLEARLEACPELQSYMLTTPILFENEDKVILTRLEKKYGNRFHVQYASNVLVVWPDVTGIDNHVKMLVVDEKYFSAGGTNLDQSLCSEGTYTPPRNTNKPAPMGNSLPAGVRDQDIVGRGEMAKDLRKTFYKLFSLWEYYNETMKLEKNPEAFAQNSHYISLEEKEKPFVVSFEEEENLVFLKKEEIRHLLSGPYQKKNVITAEYIKLIDEAKEEILIGNLYFSPADAIFQALKRAVNRGVKLTVITNGIHDRSPEYNTFFCWAHRLSFVPMFYGEEFHLWEGHSCSKKPLKKTRVFEYYVQDILYHKKMMIVDGEKLIIGSYNLGMKSHRADYEQVLVIHSKEAASRAKKVYERDLSFSTEVTPKMARDWYFNPFTVYIAEVQKKFRGLL